ncbi:MAG: DUF1283 domain-containing protein [Enterobacteriaceae bacterium]|jgi:hypothetical protein|nr:DUF1283 domain-containing protein [Enterobacteriaceae bacterium]
MNIRSSLIARTLPTIALLLPLFWQTPAFSNSITINGGGENSVTKENARQEQEAWNEQRSLRNKIYQYNEEEFDKHKIEIDNRDACLKNSNLNAYWEPKTKRCLDIQTGRPIESK